tara:strand:+ start:604 stop:804 length:201 start_codon:yes stop_codon:yes gene_type:complete
MKIEEVVKLQKRNPNYYKEIKTLNQLIDDELPLPSQEDLELAIWIVKKSYEELALLREEKKKNART